MQMEQARPPRIQLQNAEEPLLSEILSIKNGYGFIKFPPNNLFFHYSSVLETDFNDLQIGDKVSFMVSRNDEGQEIAKNVKVLREEGAIVEETEGV
jgi:cold shock CspA family protein